jgi:hypothetical protein
MQRKAKKIELIFFKTNKNKNLLIQIQFELKQNLFISFVFCFFLIL